MVLIRGSVVNVTGDEEEELEVDEDSSCYGSHLTEFLTLAPISNTFVDCQLISVNGGGSCRVNIATLVSAAPFFKTYLKTHFEEFSQEVGIKVLLTGISNYVLKKCVQFIYSGTIIGKNRESTAKIKKALGEIFGIPLQQLNIFNENKNKKIVEKEEEEDSGRVSVEPEKVIDIFEDICDQDSVVITDDMTEVDIVPEMNDSVYFENKDSKNENKDVKTRKRRKTSPISNRPLRNVCPKCGKLFETNNAMKEHLLTHNLKECVKYECDLCDKVYITNSGLANHKKTHIKGKKTHQCQFCDKSFVYTTEYKNHMNMHTKVKPFQCYDCGKFFRTKTSINDHAVIHTGVRKFVCDICWKKFTTSGNLRRHRLKVHRVTKGK